MQRTHSLDHMRPAPPPPLQPGLDGYLQAAASRLREGDYRNCYEYLDLAVTELLSQPARQAERLGPLLEGLENFQSALIVAKEFPSIREWLCPNQQGLLNRLIQSQACDRPMGELLIGSIRQACELLAGEEIPVVELKIDYLKMQYNLAKRFDLLTPRSELLLQIGNLHLVQGRILPLDEDDHGVPLPFFKQDCYVKGFREASICFNIAYDMLLATDRQDKPAIATKLLDVECAYLQRAVGSFEGLVSWAERHVWEGRSPRHAQDAVVIAELMTEYGELSNARSIYFHCAGYARKFPFAGCEQIQARHLELASSAVPQHTPSWQINRANLTAIREVTSFLFDHYFGQDVSPVPVIPPWLTPHILKALQEIGLLTLDVDGLDDLRDRLTHNRPTIHQLQLLHSQLMIRFTERLFTQALTICGPPPCLYSLVGLGSLARGEMNIYSDLDAILLVQEPSQEALHYFSKAAAYFELLVMHLGETSCIFAGAKHLLDRFCLDPAILHPARTIDVPARLVRYQEEELLSLQAGEDLNAIRNGLRLACHIVGEPQVWATYHKQLQLFFQPNGEAFGNGLLRRWQAPQGRGASFDAKKDLYRPVTLLIDALAIKHHVLGTQTTERLEGLRDHLSPDFIDLCARALELACRLRLQAQIHHQEEVETILLQPSETRGLLLSYADRLILEDTDALLFSPLAQMDLTKEIDKEIWSEAKATHFEQLVDREEMTRARAIYAEGDPPLSDSAASLALYEGDFERACDLFERQHPTGDALFESHNPYRRAMHEHSTLPPVEGLAPLAGRLRLLKMRGYRQALPEPPQTIFEGSTRERRCALWQYVTSLPLAEELRGDVWAYAHNQLEGNLSLPGDPQALCSALVGIEQADPDDLLYGNLIHLLRPILAKTQKKSVCSYLFHLFPPALKGRFLQELTRAGSDPDLIELLAHFPQPDGLRPLHISHDPAWTLLPICGSSNITFEGVTWKNSQLSAEAAAFMQALIRGRKGPYGRHSVDDLHGTFFKLSPEFPGREAAYLSLTRLITGRAYPPRELIKLQAGSHTYAITASQAVPGPSLQEVLDRSPQIANLDFRHYCFAVLMTLITLPEDAKPDNFILYAPPDGGSIQLIDIDPERAFFSAMKGRFMRSDQIQCKSILFCLDQMKQAIDPDVCAEFCALHPAALFEHWLADIDQYNQRCSELFGKSFINQSLKRDPTSVLPFFVEPTVCEAGSGMIRSKGLLLTLYERFRALQEALKTNPDIKLIDLLPLINQEMGVGYRAQLEQNKPAIQRFCDLTQDQYQRAKGSTLSMTSTRLRGAYRTIEEYRKHGWTVASAKEDLKRILVAHTTRDAIVEDLVLGEGRILKTLDLPEVSNSVLKAVDFSSLSRDSQAQILNRITGLRFNHLHLSGCQALTDKILTTILHSCPELTLLDLGNSQGITQLSYLGALCPKLKKLNLRGIATLQTLCVSDWRWRISPLSFSSLHSLDISKCPKLVTLNLKAPALRNLRCLGEYFPGQFVLDCPSLVSLSVDTDANLNRLSRYKPQRLLFGDTAIAPVDSFDPTQFRKLTSIQLSEGSIFYQTGSLDLSKVSGWGKALGYRTFVVDHRSRINPARCFIRPFERNADQAELISVVKKNRLLTSLDLSGYKITDDGVIAVAERCPQLTSLDLYECWQITDVGVRAVAEHCPQLTSLDLRGCKQITDVGVRAVAEHCSQLTSLNLYGCKQITDGGVRAVAEHCPQLTSLNLFGCKEITDGGVRAVAEHCSQLTSLDLSWCMQLTDVGVRGVAEQCPQLTSLNLSWCDKITDVGVRAVAERCPQLTSLTLYNCDKITDGGVKALRARYPNLIIKR